MSFRCRFWLVALDAAFALGFEQGSAVYLWLLQRASDATDWEGK